jgi:hypothetical protein
MNASDLTPEDRFIGLFVGPSNSGKTVAACSFQEPDPSDKLIKVFDFDGRIRGLLGAPWINRNRIKYDYYPPVMNATGISVYTKLNQDFETLLVQCGIGSNPYSTIVIDSVTAQNFVFIRDALRLTHGGKNKGGTDKGRMIGTLAMPGPDDYNFESVACNSVIAFLKSLPAVNIIVTAHIIDKYEKVDPDDPYSPSVVTGEKLSLRDKIAADILKNFDHKFRFDRKIINGEERFLVEFRGDFACTSYPNMPMGKIDITGKNFRDFLRSLTNDPNKSNPVT